MSVEDCDNEVFEKGSSFLVIDGWAKDIEPWVQKVAAKSGQRVDWHYAGGIASVLVLGDMDKALKAAQELEPELVWIEPEIEWYNSRGVPQDRPRRNPRILNALWGKK